ncbi:MAG: ComF family protein [Candidatus Omnitrophota bacterium]
MIMDVFRRVIDNLLDIVYPKTCLACKERLTVSCIDGLVCFECWQKIKRNTPPFCSSCGRRLRKENLNKSICPGCQKNKWHFDRAFSPCIYDGVIKELIHAFKYNNKDHLGFTLSRLMTDFIKEFNVPVDFVDFIVPIPLHRTRLREREFNQAEALSAPIAKEFQKPVASGLLVRARPTKTQTDLEKEMRLLNVKGSFSITNPAAVKGKNLLLVDDVLTTGATSSEAAKTLKQAGARVVFALTLAN